MNALHGKRIVNTRALHQAEAFDRLIIEHGGIPLSYPCIAIQPPEDTSEFDRCIRQLIAGEFDWLVVSSANTVMSLVGSLQALNLRLSGKKIFKIAVIGSSTAKAVTTELGLDVDVMPAEYHAQALAEAILSQSGRRIFLPESAIADPTLEQELLRGGASVQVVTAYRTVCGEGGIDLPYYLRQNQVDAITFTSSSTVRYFVERLQKDGAGNILSYDNCVACIGSKTAETAYEVGFTRVIVSRESTLNGILDTIENHFRIISET